MSPLKVLTLALALASAGSCAPPAPASTDREPPEEPEPTATQEAAGVAGAPSAAVDVPRPGPGDTLVAVPVSDLPEELVYVTNFLSEAEADDLAEAIPSVRIVRVADAGEAARYADQAHGMDAHLTSPELLARAEGLRWIQSWSAGVERYVRMAPVQERDELILTNMAGMYGPVIAEHVFAMLLSRTRDLAHYQAASASGSWSPGDPAALGALQGRTMLVVGVGGIGSEIARRAHAFGMRVIGTVRSQRPAPPYVDYLGTADELPTLLPRADVVVLAVPLTDETRRMIDANALASMREGAWLVNIARGAVIDTEALLEALDRGHLGAAFLDVTDPEPLPAGHPLWGRDNVFITPHVAGNAELSGDRALALFAENLRRLSEGEPLLNAVDKAAGY